MTMIPARCPASNGQLYPNLADGIIAETAHDPLAKPGPQPWNADIAPTLEEQYAKVFRPRSARPLSPRVLGRLAASLPALLELLTPSIVDIILALREGEQE
jgi:hypothetical protein